MDTDGGIVNLYKSDMYVLKKQSFCALFLVSDANVRWCLVRLRLDLLAVLRKELGYGAP